MNTTLKTRETTRNIFNQFNNEQLCISEGCYGAVYPKPGCHSRVIKVAKNDRAYLGFVKQALKHQDNPFFPRVYAAALYRRYGCVKIHEYLVVELERLHHNEARAARLISYLQDDENHARLKAAFERMKLPRNRVRHFHEAFNCFQQLRSRYRSDLHERNIMFRGNQPVLTDPVC